jgi:aminopeptidase-like protein
LIGKFREEWNVVDAYIIDKYNNKIIDFKKNNLHLVGYSFLLKKILQKKNCLKIYIF